MPDENSTPILSDGAYDVLNNIVKLGLPALGTAYFGLAQIWGLPYGEQVVGTLAILATLGGVLLFISKRQYDVSDSKYDGTLAITDVANPAVPTKYNFDVGDLDALENKGYVLLKVATDAPKP
jgi:hypothetical protein